MPTKNTVRYVPIQAYVHAYACTCMYVSVCCTYICKYVHVCAYNYVHVCMYISMLYVHM